jgi:hypothetical protein
LENSLAMNVYGKKKFKAVEYQGIFNKSMRIKCKMEREMVKRLLIEVKNRNGSKVEPMKGRSVSDENQGIDIEPGIELSEFALVKLSEGPKSAPEIVPTPEEVVHAIREVAEYVHKDDRVSFIEDCYRDSQVNQMNFKSNKVFKEMRQVAEEIDSKGLILCMGDKSGKFAIIKKESYEEKRRRAFEKNFRKVGKMTCGIGNAKKEVLEILRENGMTQLAGRMNTASGNWLSCFTSVKTHKMEWPLRIIITEKDTWLDLVSSFIQTGLSMGKVEDPWRVKNSEEAVERMGLIHKEKVKVFSLDIEDMYFNVNINTVLRLFKKKIIELGEDKFKDMMKITLDDFLEIVRIYFNHTIIKVDEYYYTQKKGACIGSKAAPLTSEIFLEYIDQLIRAALSKKFGDLVKLIMRFVDDYWCAIDESMKESEVAEMFNEYGEGLVFTMEKEEKGKGLQFLDTCSSTVKGGLCWDCKQRTPKPLLPWKSNHAREIKESVVVNCLKTAVLRSCPCGMKKSLEIREDRLRVAGYPEDFMMQQKVKIIMNWNRKKKESQEDKRMKYVGIQRYHKLTHVIGKQAGKRDVKVVSKYQVKNKNIMYMKKAIGKTVNGCEEKHKKSPFECEKNCVYSIGLSCNRQYIGQTSKCVNERLGEHLSGDAIYSTFNEHKKQCHCKVGKCRTFNRKQIKSTHVRMLVETMSMEDERKKNGKDSVISKPSIHPTRREREFIEEKFKMESEM